MSGCNRRRLIGTTTNQPAAAADAGWFQVEFVTFPISKGQSQLGHSHTTSTTMPSNNTGIEDSLAVSSLLRHP